MKLRLVLALLALLLPDIAVAQAPDFGVPPTGAQNLAGAGTTQNTAFPVPAQINVFANVASGAGAILPASPANITVINNGANALLLYPSSGDRIDAGAPNAPVSIAAGSQLSVTMTDAPLSPRPHVWRSMGGGGDGGTTNVLPTGATVPRTPSAVAGDTINPLFFNPNGTPVDITGATDAQPAINAAIIQACATNAIRTKSVHIPPGKYLFNNLINLPANCSNLTLDADPHQVVWTASSTNAPTNTNIPLLLQWTTGNDDITVNNIIFDGGSLASPPNTASNGLVRVNNAARNPHFNGIEIRHSAGTGMWVVSGSRITLPPLATEINWGDTVINFTGTLPTSLKVGANWAPSGFQDHDYYVQSKTSNTITVQKPLTDFAYINTKTQWTPALVLSATANVNDTVLLTASTEGLANQQTLYSGLTTANCLLRGTRIVSFVTNTSVVIDKPVQCQIASGTGIASILGIPGLQVQNSKFYDLGQNRYNSGTATYTTATDTPSGNTVTFNCFSGRNCFRVGPIAGNSTMPDSGFAAMPNNNLVQDQINVNAAAGTFQLVMANPVTSDVPAGTPIKFTAAAISGVGYGLWFGFGNWFGNFDYIIDNNYWEDTFSTPLFPANVWNLQITRNVFQINRHQYQNAAGVAPSGCTGAINTVNQTLADNWCSGTTGDGMDLNHPVNLIMRNNHFFGTNFSSINVFGGRNMQIIGNTISNPGQNVNYNKSNIPAFLSSGTAGMNIQGSWTAGRLGILDGLLLNDTIISDDQPVHTMQYGIVSGNHASSATNTSYGLQLIITGDTVLATDPILGITPLPAGTDNRIVNPCMTIDQRNEGAIATGSSYGPDQWRVFSSPFSVKYQRSATTQNGCANSLKMTVNATVAPTVGQFSLFQQIMETGNLLDLRYGTVLAATVIVDFCAQATTAGTYGWGLSSNFPSAGLRAYASSYTLAAPNVSQCFSFTVAGDQVSALNSSSPTAAGLQINFDGGSGSDRYAASCNSWQTITVNTNYFCNTSSLLNAQAPGQTIEITAVRFYPAAVDVAWVGLAAAQAPYRTTRYFSKTFPLGVVPAQNAGTSGALCDTYANMALLPVPGLDWTYPTDMRTVPSIVTFNPKAANANFRDTTALADVTATINADALQDNSQVLLGASPPVVPDTDLLCIQATANSSF